MLFIGLLGQRFGTPTDLCESGTEEEFLTAIAYRREQGDYPEIKWFFRKGFGKAGQPTNPDAMKVVSEQWAKVNDFRETLMKEGELQAYIMPFEDSDEFANLFSQDLNRWLHDPARPWHQTSDNVPTDTPRSISEKDYFAIWQRQLAMECARLPLEVLDARQGLQQSVKPNWPTRYFCAAKNHCSTEKMAENKTVGSSTGA